jgi:hypothetical protein
LGYACARENLKIAAVEMLTQIEPSSHPYAFGASQRAELPHGCGLARKSAEFLHSLQWIEHPLQSMCNGVWRAIVRPAHL